METEKICFYSHHTPKYEYYFSYDFLCVCTKERVEIKDKTNKDSKPKAYVWASNTQNKTGAVKQMTPLKCEIFHRFWQLRNAALSTFHLSIIQRDVFASPKDEVFPNCVTGCVSIIPTIAMVTNMMKKQGSGNKLKMISNQ